MNYVTSDFTDHNNRRSLGRRIGALSIKARQKLLRTRLKKGLRNRLMAQAKDRFKERFGFHFPDNPQLFPPDYLDLENLVDQVLTQKPRRILELGGGYSTYALAYAVNRLISETGQDCEFISVDQSADYLEVTRANLPPELATRVTFLHRDLYLKKRDGILMSFFHDLPAGGFDFLYEDRCDHAETPVAGDVFDIEDQAIAGGAPFSFTIDLMIATAEVCKRRLRRNYAVTGEYVTGTNFTQIVAGG